jgi:hypothetical protein
VPDRRREHGGGARRKRVVVLDRAADGEALAGDGGAGGVAALEQRGADELVAARRGLDEGAVAAEGALAIGAARERAGDPEAFAEIIERYDPVVRYKIWRVLGRLVPAEALDAQIAGFWCALLADDKSRLREWEWERGERFASWLGNLALRVGGERLSRILRDKAAA